MKNYKPNSAARQVMVFREKLKLRTDLAAIRCDAAAIRGFVTLVFRRHDGHKRQVHRLHLISLSQARVHSKHQELFLQQRLGTLLCFHVQFIFPRIHS